MKIFRIFSLLALLIVANAAVSNAQNAGHLVGYNGAVEVFRNDAWTAGALNDAILSGEKVRTGAAAVATIAMGGGVIVTIPQSSQVEFQSNTLILNSGSLQVISPAAMRVRARASTIEAVQFPVEMEVTLGNGDTAEVNVTAGAIQVGGVVIKSVLNSTQRTYTTGGRRHLAPGQQQYLVQPNIFVYPQVPQPRNQ